MIVNCGVHMLGNSFVIEDALNITQLRPATEHYMSKVKSTLKQIVRDWSAEGNLYYRLFTFSWANLFVEKHYYKKTSIRSWSLSFYEIHILFFHNTHVVGSYPLYTDNYKCQCTITNISMFEFSICVSF